MPNIGKSFFFVKRYIPRFKILRRAKRADRPIGTAQQRAHGDSALRSRAHRIRGFAQ